MLFYFKGWSCTDADRAAIRGAGRPISSDLDISVLLEGKRTLVSTRRSALHTDPQLANVWAYKASDLDAKNTVCVLPSRGLAGCLKDGKAKKFLNPSLFQMANRKWLHWLQKEVRLYLSLWENDPTSHLIFYLSEPDPKEFMVPIASFKSSSTQRDDDFVNWQNKINNLRVNKWTKILPPIKYLH